MSSTTPCISVITLTSQCIKNNRASYLRQCIESVSNQTYKNIEHIIIDNASTDGTLDILKDYLGIKVFSKPDKGICDAMNIGYKHAKGKYILYLNSDDFLANDTSVEKAISALESGDYDFVCGVCNILDAKDNIADSFIQHPERIFAAMPFAHPACIVKRSIIESLGGFDTSYKIAGDYDLILRMAINGSHGVMINDILTNFRQTGISSIRPDITTQETIQCLIKNLKLSKKRALFANKWGYIPISLLKPFLVNLQQPFEVKKIRTYNLGRLLHFLKRQLFTLHLGKNVQIKILGITIFNNKKRDKQ